MAHYDPQGFALKIFKDRYSLHKDETYAEACDRVAGCVAAAETNGNVVRYRQEFVELLRNNYFCPGGRIWYGAGRPKGQLLNCFVAPTGDSREAWGKTFYDETVICGTGGGLGINFSPTRPRGSVISGHKGPATGAVSEMECVDAIGERLKAGGGRRTALMFALGLSHGDILEFLDKKLDLKQLNNANVSVVFDEDPLLFFEKVKNDEPLELMHKGRRVGEISSKLIWSKIIKNALTSGEPGLLNGYLANKMSNIWYYAQLICTNPCITGDTLIAVADGRNAVSIKQLAEEGKDVPVYSVHPGTGQIEIKWGINPRRTGEKKEILKLTLDDGSVIRTTSNHRFLLRDLTERRMDELQPGDSLLLRSKWKTSWSELTGEKCNSRSQDYWMLSTGKKNRFEHGLIAEFNLGRKISSGEVVHHKDFQGLNNSPENLCVMSKDDHDAYHASLMKGENNPYHRMTGEWKENFARHEGSENGMFGKENKWGHHTDEAKEAIRQKLLGMTHTEEMGKKVSESRIRQTQKKYEDAGIPQYVKKTCPYEQCSREFVVHWREREQMYCSKDCFLQVFNRRKDVSEDRKKGWQEKRDIKREQWLRLYTQRRFELGRHLGKQEWEEYLKSQGLPSRFGRATFLKLEDLHEAADSYNHRVVSVELDGHEDVYNITVQDNHNYCIVLSVEAKTKSGKTKHNYIVTPQCGEIWLAAYDCCCLGALVLPRFVEQLPADAGRNPGIDWDLLRESITLSIRFLDNVLSVNNYPLPEIAEVCSNIRRIGLGVMGLHDMLLMLGLKYDSDAGLETVDKVMAFIKNASYEASIGLAKEKGPFPAFDAEKFLKGGFAKTLKPSIRSEIRKHGIRNCALNTIAPTGTTALLCECSGGIETMYSPASIRTYRDGDQLMKEVVVHPLLKRFFDEGRSTRHFQGAYDIELRDHFEMQRTCQKHLDNACSKTINIVPGVSEETLSDLYMEFFPELKGVTVYPEGSREAQPLTPIPLSDAIQYLKGKITLEALTDDPCRSGKCDI